MREYLIKIDDFRGQFDDSYPIIEKKELMRCKDCVWFRPWGNTGGICDGFGDGCYVPEDGYCHNAERKEEQTELNAEIMQEIIERNER